MLERRDAGRAPQRHRRQRRRPDPLPGSHGGVVPASHTWSDDALRWDSPDDAERYPYALHGMQEVYGQWIEVFCTGHGQTRSRLRNRYSLGEAAVFTPGRLTTLHPAITTPGGRCTSPGSTPR